MTDITPGKIRIVGAPPGTGKSTLRKPLVAELKKSGQSWLVMENEDNLGPDQKVAQAHLSGLRHDSPEFVRAIALPGQLKYQEAMRTYAAQGHNIVGFGPFENMTSQVDGLPLLEKMKSDFCDFDFNLLYVLTWPNEVSIPIHSNNVIDHPEMQQVETAIKNRLEFRMKSSGSLKVMDTAKVKDAHYYRGRAQSVLTSAETFKLQVLHYRLVVNPEDFAISLAKAILAS